MRREYERSEDLIAAISEAGHPDAKSAYLRKKKELALAGLAGLDLFDSVIESFGPVLRGEVFQAPERKPAVEEVIEPEVELPIDDGLRELQKRTCSAGKTVDWVMQNLDAVDLKFSEIPSLGAYSLRNWARTNPLTRSEFYRIFGCKRLPATRLIDIQDRMKDDGHDLDEKILAVIRAEEIEDDESLLEGGSEESYGESEVSQESY